MENIINTRQKGKVTHLTSTLHRERHTQCDKLERQTKIPNFVDRPALNLLLQFSNSLETLQSLVNSCYSVLVSDLFIFDFQSFPPYCDDPIQFCFRRRAISCGQPLYQNSFLISPFYTFIPYILEADFVLVSAFPVSFAFCWTAINPVSIFSSHNEKTKTSSSIRWTVSCNVRCSTHSHINGGSVCSSRLELGVPVWTSIHSQGQWKYRLLWCLLADGSTLEVQSLTSLGFRCSVHKCTLHVRYNLKFFFCIIFQRCYSPWLQHPHRSLPIGC